MISTQNLQQSFVRNQLRLTCTLLAVVSFISTASAQFSAGLSLSSVSTTDSSASVDLFLDSTTDLESIQAIFDWNASIATGVGFTPAPAIDDANVVVTRTESDYFVLGVIADTDGGGGEVIPSGNDVRLGTLQLDRAGIGFSSLSFRDATYSAAEGQPALDNLVVEGGVSFGADDGLTLSNGFVEFREPPSYPGGLSLGNVSTTSSSASIEIVLNSMSELEGIQAAFDWDPSIATGVGFTPAPSIANLDLLVTRTESDYFVLGVIADTDGVGDEIIASGSNIVLGMLELDRAGFGASPIRFRDAMYSVNVDTPVLDNLVVDEGLSIGVDDGLSLTDGSVEFVARGPHGITVGDKTVSLGATFTVPVLLTNQDDASGFVAAVQHDPAVLAVTDIHVAGASLAADFIEAALESDGAALGVVMDLFEPFDNATIPPGTDQLVAEITYSVVATAPTTTELTLVDGVLGDPPKDNQLVFGGVSVGADEGLALHNGTITIVPEPRGLLLIACSLVYCWRLRHWRCRRMNCL